MKTPIIYLIGIILVITLSIFTVLYFTNPRVVETERIVEIIPDKVEVKWEKAIPDVIRDTIYVVEEIEISAMYSGKTFTETLYSKDSVAYGEVTSQVGIYAPCPVYHIENSIELTPYKQALAQSIMENMPKQNTGWKFGTGVAVGTVATIGLGTAIYMIVR